MAFMSEKEVRRCSWATNDLLIQYHDTEYGKLCEDNDAIFEKICLESFSCGLSWYIVLKKRGALKKAFCDFHIDACAALSNKDLQTIATLDGVIKNARKIEAVAANARSCQDIISAYGSLIAFIRGFEDGEALCKGLKKFGVRQFGPVCANEVLKSLGLVPAHEPDCDLAIDGSGACQRS